MSITISDSRDRGSHSPRSLRISQISDQRFALFSVFHARVNHFGPQHKLIGVAQMLIQLSLVPDDVRVLVCFGLVEPGDGSGLSADDACEVRAETVLAGLERMADPTAVAKQSMAVLLGAYA